MGPEWVTPVRVDPVVLTGRRVTLEPLRPEHAAELAAASADGDVGALWFTSAPSPTTARQWIDARLAVQHPDSGLTFVVRDNDRAGTVVGSSSYLHADPPNRRVEIGHTWYSASARRTGVNVDCKLQMLRHAFDQLGCVAIELRTHFQNAASRGAIERLGAKLDGILRSHQLLADPTVRSQCRHLRRWTRAPEMPAAARRRHVRVRVLGFPDRSHGQSAGVLVDGRPSGPWVERGCAAGFTADRAAQPRTTSPIRPVVNHPTGRI